MAYVFNDTTYAQDGLIQECEDISGLGEGSISGNTSRLKKFTRRINNALDRFYSLAFQYDSLWNMDDRKYADSNQQLPIASTNLVSGQADYLFDDELLGVTQVFCKDSSGTWRELQPQDDKTSPNIYVGATSGLPARYELVGNSIILDPIPNYNSTLGLKVTFRRNGTKFTHTDGAIAVGIPSLFHSYLARHASYQHLIEKSLPWAALIAAEIQKDEEAIKRFIAQRAKPKRAGLSVTKENNR
jgi:hypothetical protein